jgi:hypothetical protein
MYRLVGFRIIDARPAIQNFEREVRQRHQVLAISLYFISRECPKPLMGQVQ